MNDSKLDWQTQQDQFNQHQTDVRLRVDSLAKAIFLLSGGALTFSIGIFSSPEVVVSQELLCPLKVSWWLLFYSMIAFLSLVSLVLYMGFVFGERWAGELYDGSEAERPIKMYIPMQWFFFSGLIAFMFGFFGLIYVAAEHIG